MEAEAASSIGCVSAPPATATAATTLRESDDQPGDADTPPALPSIVGEAPQFGTKSSVVPDCSSISSRTKAECIQGGGSFHVVLCVSATLEFEKKL